LLRRGRGSEVARRPHHRTELATDLSARSSHRSFEGLPVGPAHNEQIDIARGVVLGRDIGTEKEGEGDAWIALEDLRQPDRDAASPYDQVANGGVEGVIRDHLPQPEVAHAPAP
jgi:hypothetical protein